MYYDTHLSLSCLQQVSIQRQFKTLYLDSIFSPIVITWSLQPVMKTVDRYPNVLTRVNVGVNRKWVFVHGTVNSVFHEN